MWSIKRGFCLALVLTFLPAAAGTVSAAYSQAEQSILQGYEERDGQAMKFFGPSVRVLWNIPENPQLINDTIAAFARQVYDTCIRPEMTPEERIKAAFDYIADRDHFPYEQNRIPYYYGDDWPLVYAEDLRTLGASSCQGLSALFGYVARLCNYSEDIYWCSNQYHAWVEIDGHIYDPVFLESTHETLVYDWDYAQGADRADLGAGYEDLSEFNGTWQYLKVPEI